MFTMPAIHHSSVRAEDGSMGTMHLNALNGSTNVLGCNNFDSNDCSCHSNAFGGLIGVTLSENHPYRPQDCGLTFHGTPQRSQIANIARESSSSSSPSKQRSNNEKALSKHPDAATQAVPHRRSFELNVASSSSHRRYEDRSLSLDALVLGPFSRIGRFIDDADEEQDLAPDLNNLNISESEAARTTLKPHGLPQNVKAHHTKDKGKRFHLKDSSMLEKSLKLMGKNKDSKKDHNSNFKLSQPRTVDIHRENGEHVKQSKLANLQHIFWHLSDPSVQEKQS